MNPAKVLIVTLLAGTLSIGIALYGERWLADRESGGFASDRSGQDITSLPDIRLPDTAGREIASNSWAGKVVVLNYWATWCPACLREMPMLARLQQRFDPGRLHVVGIAIDDADSVRDFLAEHSVDYQILLGDAASVVLSERLGNRTSGLPFTAIFDSVGRLVFTHTGEMTSDLFRAQLKPLLGGEPG
ncbi:MAG: TlpA disulfide reductase family protein [Thiohalocapsa sp.]